MAYLYGDSSESPLEINYIEFLRDALDFAVEVLVSDYRVQALQESCDEHKRSAEVELQQLRALSERVNQLMAEPVGAPQSPAQRCAAQIRQGAEDAIVRMAGQIKQGLADQLAQVAAQVQRERSSPLRAIETLLRHRDLPDSTSHVEVALSGSRTGYAAYVRGRADIGLEWTQTLDIPAAHLFGQLLRVERLSPNLEVKLPEKGGWMRKGMRVRAHRIGGNCIIEVIHAPHQTSFKLRAGPEEDEAGYNVILAAGEPRVRLVQVVKGGEHSPPFEPMEEDVPRFLDLAHVLTEAADDLTRSRGALREARIDGKPIGDIENPSVLVKRLVAKLAPVVTEIARHSLAPDELVLKRVVTDDRREEIFAAKADLMAKLEPVPLALRGVFAPLGLGDLGRPGGRSAYGDGRVWAGRVDTNDSVTEELRSSGRAAELMTLQGPPGVMSSAARPDGGRGPGAAHGPGPVTSPMGAGALSRAAGNAHPQPAITMRGMNPVQPPAPARGDEEITMVADREKVMRPPGGNNSTEDSIDVALSELEHDHER